MDKELLLISHGNFCVELLRSVEMIMGPQESIKTLPLHEEEGKEEYKEELKSIINIEKETIILADLKGGTPSNVASELLMSGYSFNLYTGMNMPMIIDYINSEMLGIDYDPMNSGKNNIVFINELLNT